MQYLYRSLIVISHVLYSIPKYLPKNEMPIIRSLFVDYLYRTVKDCNGSYRLILSRERSLVKKQNELKIDSGSFYSCLVLLIGFEPIRI